jgi:tetratricopeptide (TPR) repeat protein
VSLEKLNNAIQLVKSGNKQAALPLLKEVIQADPQNENAWLWLYSCVDKVEQKKVCLQKALEINPGNQNARNALKKLSDLTPGPAQQFVQGGATPPQPAPRDESGPRRSRRTWFLALLGAGLFLLVCGVSFLLLVQNGLASSLAASLPFFPSATLTASTTPTFTATATPSPSPTATRTATRRPSATPTLLPSLTPTIAAFTFGNPTATPLGSDITDPNFKKGVAAFDKAIERNGRDYSDYQPVVDLMNAVIAANSELAPPYRYRGVSYWYLGDCDSALADVEKALSINPNYAAAWGGRGLIDECLGNSIESLQDYQKALSLDPSLAWVHNNLGVYYYKIGNYQKSLEEYNLSLAIDPSRSDVRSGVSEALAKLGRLDECIAGANKALQADRREWVAYADRGFCELMQGTYTEAIKDFKVYVAHKPDDSVASYNLGVAYGHRGNLYYSQGKYTLAIADYKKAVSLVRGDAHSYCNMSYSYFALKQYKGALEAAKSSIAINPECGGQKLLEVAARSAYALHDYDQGIDYMNQALARGAYALGYYYRGIIFQAAGKNEEAILDLKHFLASGGNGEEAADAKARLAKLES